MRLPVIMIAVLALMASSKSVFASCYTNAAGRVECNNGEQAGERTPTRAMPGIQKKPVRSEYDAYERGRRGQDEKW